MLYRLSEGVSKLKNSEKRQIVGAAGIPARSTASSSNLLSILLKCRRQENITFVARKFQSA